MLHYNVFCRKSKAVFKVIYTKASSHKDGDTIAEEFFDNF